MLGVVHLRQFRRDAHHLHGEEIQTLILEAADDAAHQSPLDAVGLEKNEGALHGKRLPA